MQALAACLAMPAAALAAVPPSPASNALVDQFMAAGGALLGLKLDDRDLALPYINLMRKQFSDAQLQAFVAANAPGKSPGKSPAGAAKRKTGAIERQAMLLWLTGHSVDAAGKTAAVVTYTRAAVWSAMPFTKPPGWCGGDFGYWAHPPVAR